MRAFPLFAAGLLAAASGCFLAVDPGGTGDAGFVEGKDAGVVDEGRDAGPQCVVAADCEGLPQPKCLGAWICASGTCAFPCVGAGCSSDSSCPAGEVCVSDCAGARVCVAGCRSSDQCGAGRVCVPTATKCGDAYGLCQVSAACTDDSKCPSGTVCGTTSDDCTKHCVPGCHRDDQCASGQCAPPPPCAGCGCDHGTCVGGSGCAADAECPAGEVCEPGAGCAGPNACVPGCHESSQCGKGQACDTSEVCLTCPCPGRCVSASCTLGVPSCATSRDCTWNRTSCQGGCCKACLVPPSQPCSSTQCAYGGGIDGQGCSEGTLCGKCCACAGGPSVCATNYQTYLACEATCLGLSILHAGACLAYEGLECAWDGGSDGACPSGMYCRDPCPMCGSIQRLRCTQVGACAQDWDCPAGLSGPRCANGQQPSWSCVDHRCSASCQ